MRYREAAVRRDELRRRVEQQGYVASRSVAAELGVSDMTVRRDLDQLAEQGLVLRVVGGARRPDGAPFVTRAVAAAAAKEQVGALAAGLLAGELVGPGAVVALDAGTTVEQVARRLPGGLTVVDALGPGDGRLRRPRRPHPRGPGRRVPRPHPLLRRPRDLRPAGRPGRRPRRAVRLGAARRRALLPRRHRGRTKRTLLAAAAQVLVVADAGKLGARAPVHVAGWDAVDGLVTDDGLDDRGRARLARWAPRVPVRTPAGRLDPEPR